MNVGGTAPARPGKRVEGGTISCNERGLSGIVSGSNDPLLSEVLGLIPPFICRRVLRLSGD